MKAVYTLILQTLENRPGGFVEAGLAAPPDFPSWRPGQFLSLRKTIDGKAAIRTYSISTLPGEGLRLLVRREANGLFSRWLADYARIGDTVEALAPSGNFTLPETLAPLDNLVLLAAGSGIAPIRPLALQALHEGYAARVHLLYSAFNESAAPFFKEFEALSEPSPTFKFSPFLSLMPNGQPNRLTNIRLEAYMAANVLRPGQSNLFFICGPISYRRMVRFTLRTLGFDAAQIREENFDPEVITRPSRPVLKQDALIKATLPTGAEVQFACKPHESILAAGLRQGIDLPYSCKGGVCSSCTARLISGKTHMTINEILSPDDIARHLTLTCTALPASEEIELDYSTPSLK